MKDIKRLRNSIGRIYEQLGKQNVRMFKGSGASQPYYTHSGKQMLGDIDPFGINDTQESKKRTKKPVVVSKAFSKKSEEQIVTEKLSTLRGLFGGYGRRYGGFGIEDEDEELAGGTRNYTGDAPSSTSVEPSAAARAVELAKATGLDPAFIYATERKESRHNPTAMAWNVHIMRNPDWASKAGVPEKALTKNQSETLDSLGFPKSKSYYKNEAWGAFNKASEVNPWAAISGGAWGLYQVLGAFTLPDYGNDPVAWKAAFDADPTEFSKKSFIKWVKDKGPSFVQQANNGNYVYTTNKYFGGSNPDYASDIAKYVRKYDEGSASPPAPTSTASATYSKSHRKGRTTSWKGLLGKERAGGINFHELETGNNNYRGGIKPKHTTPSPEFFKELKDVYGIKNVITLNADNGGNQVPAMVEAVQGMTSLYIPTGDSKEGTLELDSGQWAAIKGMLDDGNTLIHCTHGADRTGATVARYYVEKGFMDEEEALADANKYKSGNMNSRMTRFIMNGVEGDALTEKIGTLRGLWGGGLGTSRFGTSRFGSSDGARISSGDFTTEIPPGSTTAFPVGDTTGTGKRAAITSKAGYRGKMKTTMGSAGGKPHGAWDMGAKTGTPIVAYADGNIVAARDAGSGGNIIAIDHPFSWTDGENSGPVQTQYMHLSEFIKTSGPVKAGEVIALSGATGNVRGAHLHFVIKVGGKSSKNDELYARALNSAPVVSVTKTLSEEQISKNKKIKASRSELREIIKKELSDFFR